MPLPVQHIERVSESIYLSRILRSLATWYWSPKDQSFEKGSLRQKERVWEWGDLCSILVLLIINAEVVHNHNLSEFHSWHEFELNTVKVSFTCCSLRSYLYVLLSPQKLNWGLCRVPGLYPAHLPEQQDSLTFSPRGRNLYLTSLETRKGRGGDSWGNHLYLMLTVSRYGEIYLWKLKTVKYNATSSER